MWAIETHNLTKIYQNQQIALNGVNLRVEPGSVVGLLGPNGAGKTTLIRLVLGLHRPSAGWVEVFTKTMHANAASLRRRIGYLPSTPHFPPAMTPITYLDYVGKLFGLSAERRRPKLGMLVRAVDLLGASAQKLRGLSTGQLTRLAIAASLMNDPEILIWDEPTYGLDPEARRCTINLIKELAEDRTLILSSHLLGDIDEVCDCVVVLNRGELIFDGTISELKGKMRRDQFEFLFDGKQKSIDALKKRLVKLDGVQAVSGTGSRVAVVLKSGQDSAAILAEALMVISESDVVLISIRTSGYQTEEAFLELVESDQARGFTRAAQRKPA